MPSWSDPTRPQDKSGSRKTWQAVKRFADEKFELGLVDDKKATPNVFRHTFVNRHSMAGVDIADIHDLVGHETAKMITYRYRHSDVPRLREVATTMEDHFEELVMNPSSALA